MRMMRMRWVIFLCLLVLLQLVSTISLPSGSGKFRKWTLFPRGGESGDDNDDDEENNPRNFKKKERMPSLFPPQESQYDRYAACLAATEGLRRKLDKDLSKEGRYRKGQPTESQQRIRSEFVMNSGKVINAMGMSVSQFNRLARQISQDSALKEKVLKQAFLYRIAATIEMDKMPLIEDPASEELLEATRPERLQLFCNSVQEIEQLQSNQMEKLKRVLHVNQLPEGISLSDPSVLPFLAPRVRAVVEAFPLQAEEIVKKHGLHSDEFTEMLEEAKSSPDFRRKLEDYMKQNEVEKENDTTRPLK